MVVSGTLPKLVVHINEDKVHTLQRMARLLIGDIQASGEAGQGRRTQQQHQGCQTDDLSAVGATGGGADDGGGGEEFFFPNSAAGGAEMDGSAKLLLLYFCVSDMAVELQSQGQPVAELQVGQPRFRILGTVRQGNLKCEKTSQRISRVPLERLK